MKTLKPLFHAFVMNATSPDVRIPTGSLNNVFPTIINVEILADSFPDITQRGIKGIQYFAGYYWVAINSEPFVYKSTDFITWTLGFIEPRDIYDVGQLFIFKDELYLFTTKGDTNIHKTSDGITWNLVYETEDWFEGYHEMPIIVEDGKMYILSYGAGMLSTTDGVTWDFDQVQWEYFTDAVIVDGWIYGVFNNTDNNIVKFLASDPVGTWETQTPFPSEYIALDKISYYKGAWYIGDFDQLNIYRSTDFINWVIDYSLPYGYPDLLKVNNGYLFMVGNNGKIYIRNVTEWEESFDMRLPPYNLHDFDIYNIGQVFINDNWYYSAYDGLARINIQYP